MAGSPTPPRRRVPSPPRFLPWPEDALTSVSGKFIDEFSMACPKEVKNQLKLLMGHAHVCVTNACKEYFEKYRRYVYVTPKSYLSFLQVRPTPCPNPHASVVLYVLPRCRPAPIGPPRFLYRPAAVVTIVFDSRRPCPKFVC